jgi:hypothetical protein
MPDSITRLGKEYFEAGAIIAHINVLHDRLGKCELRCADERRMKEHAQGQLEHWKLIALSPR